jgi:hypothetical protein
MKTQWDEGSGRILLGDNTDNGAVMLRPFSFQCAEFVFQLEHTIQYTHLRLEPDLPVLNYCVSRKEFLYVQS